MYLVFLKIRRTKLVCHFCIPNTPCNQRGLYNCSHSNYIRIHHHMSKQSHQKVPELYTSSWHLHSRSSNHIYTSISSNNSIVWWLYLKKLLVLQTHQQPTLFSHIDKPYVTTVNDSSKHTHREGEEWYLQNKPLPSFIFCFSVSH